MPVHRLPADAAAKKHDRRWRKYSADFTPPEVIEQALLACGIIEHLAMTCPMDPFYVLCPNAGAGAYAMVLRYLAKKHVDDANIHITAIEIRDEEREHLERWCDDVIIGDALEELPILQRQFHWIVDNPAFPFIHQLIPACARVLTDTGDILFLAPHSLCRARRLGRCTANSPAKSRPRCAPSTALRDAYSFGVGGTQQRASSTAPICASIATSTGGARMGTPCGDSPKTEASTPATTYRHCLSTLGDGRRARAHSSHTPRRSSCSMSTSDIFRMACHASTETHFLGTPSRP